MRTIYRLQLTQNTAARVITRASRYSHITDTLKRLHWLPISKRCQFKILVMSFKVLHNTAPTYLCDILKWYRPARLLRSASTTSLVPCRHRTIRFFIFFHYYIIWHISGYIVEQFTIWCEISTGYEDIQKTNKTILIAYNIALHIFVLLYFFLCICI